MKGRPMMFGMARDISPRKRMEKEREQWERQRRQLEKKESLNRMAGAIVHHFNNILMVVSGNLELAIYEVIPGGPAYENITSALRASRRAEELGRLMLTYLGQTAADREPVDVSAFCEKILPVLKSGMREGIVLEADLPLPGPVVEANVDEMRDLLKHLIANAAESGRGTPCFIQLSIRTVSAAEIPMEHRFPIDWHPAGKEHACLEVRDTGCGIPEPEIERIFDPFFSTKFTGRGLGLAVVLGITRAHHGVITVESVPDHGSVFRVFLPLFPSSSGGSPEDGRLRGDVRT